MALLESVRQQPLQDLKLISLYPNYLKGIYLGAVLKNGQITQQVFGQLSAQCLPVVRRWTES